MQIAKEQISDLKNKLIEADNAKGVAEFARDEAVRAKQEAKFARTEAETAKDKAKEEGYEAGVAETQASFKAQIPGVCRLYCSQVWNEALLKLITSTIHAPRFLFIMCLFQLLSRLLIGWRKKLRGRVRPPSLSAINV